MRTKPGPSARPRAAAACALLTGALLLPAAPSAQEPGPDCEIEKLADWVTMATKHEVTDENFACLKQRIDALEHERETLVRRIENLEDRDALATTVYVNRDGEVTQDERHLGPATFALTGDRRGRPRSLALDRSRVMEMCADAEGCLINLGLKGIVIGDEPIEAMFSGGPCIFHLDGPENAWAVSGHCADVDLPAPVSADAGEGQPAEGEPDWGRNGDASPIADPRQQGRVVLAFGGACLLTEAPPDIRSATAREPRFERDTSPDLFLVTAGAGWEPAGSFPAELLPLAVTHPDFECRLTVRD